MDPKTIAKNTHGGRRTGAGRKKTGRKLGGPHRRRPDLDARHPVHTTLRLIRGLPSLRQREYYQAIRRVLARYLDGAEFRVVHISIQKTHLHLITEAASKAALERGMRSFAINAARAINRAWGRGGGKVFAYRYTASQIKTASYARNAISYVLNNWRRHREDFANGRRIADRLDEYSSALSFTGWTVRWGAPSIDYEPLPVSAPRTSLLREDWKRFGLIRHDEAPGPIF